MPKFRKKPVVIDARKFDGSWESAEALVFWINSEGGDSYCQQVECGDYVGLYIQTLEGQHQASTDDWIIKGVADEFYPCKPDIFAATYEPVDD